MRCLGAATNTAPLQNQCLTFCINYKLTTSYLVSSWEVYYLNRQLEGLVVHNAHMDGFLLHLQSEQKEAIIKEEANRPYIYSVNDVNIHTAAIAVGNNGISVRMHGFQFGKASGMAPRARIAVYKAVYKLFGGFVADGGFH